MSRMIVIGEKLNSSIPSSYQAMLARDEAALIAWIGAQVQADYLDLNTAMFREEETDRMLWLIDLVKQHSAAGISIDSQNLSTILAAAEAASDRKLLINSVTIEQEFQPIFALAAKIHCGLVCMSLGDDPMAEFTVLTERAKQYGIPMQNLYLDVALASIAANDQAGREAVSRIKRCKAQFPDCHIICGLSNLSFGMPGRERLNSVMLGMAAVMGLDSVILNAMDPTMLHTLAAVRLLQGEDEYGLDYIAQMRTE